jgi:hypothetical protein
MTKKHNSLPPQIHREAIAALNQTVLLRETHLNSSN